MNKDVHKDLKKQIEDLEAIKSTDSKEVIKDKLNKEANVLRKIYTTDAFQNQMARLGFGQPNLANGAEYPITRLSQNYNLLLKEKNKMLRIIVKFCVRIFTLFLFIVVDFFLTSSFLFGLYSGFSFLGLVSYWYPPYLLFGIFSPTFWKLYFLFKYS